MQKITFSNSFIAIETVTRGIVKSKNITYSDSFIAIETVTRGIVKSKTLHFLIVSLQ